MSGRNLFNHVRPVLNVLVVVFRIFPQGLRDWLWKLTDLLPRVVAVGVRYALAKASGAELGDNVYFGHNVTVKYWRKLKIGQDVSIHENCFIDALGSVVIGSQVSVAHGSSIISFDHNYVTAGPIKYGDLITERISIGNDVWISAGVRILKGSTISDRVVVGTNAVVKGSLSANAIYAGMPAKLIKQIKLENSYTSAMDSL